MDLIKYSTHNRRAYIMLNRPEKRNALSAELVSELKDAFDQAQHDPEVKVIILGAEGKAFCAGADLAYLRDLQGFSYAENLADSNKLKDLFLKIYSHPKPVIARVQGHAIAGGCGLATVCDFIYCAEEAKFGYTEVKIGFVPAIVMLFLLRKIGEARATSLLLSGELISAQEALSFALVHKVCKAEELMAEVEALADLLITTNSGASMQLTKSLLKQVQETTLESALELAAEANAQARATDDCRMGISSFLNKQPLKW